MKNLLLCILLGVIVGCVQLPEHARPRLNSSPTANLSGRNGFGYRQLAVKDFQAESLPADYRQFNHRIGAQSCITLRPSADSKIHIVQSYYQDRLLYFGTLSQLSYGAVFVPDCSWWNPELDKSKEEYVLQHEQIHFGLAELAARRLTREKGAEVGSYLAIGESHDEILEELTGKLKGMERDAMELGIEEHTDFDEETSLSHNPGVQRRWLENVNNRLAEEADKR